MIIKPEQSRGQWCPFARVYLQKVDYSCNRRSSGMALKESFCIADKCMMWRWTKNTEEKMGYCGLAGEPAEIQ